MSGAKLCQRIALEPSSAQGDEPGAPVVVARYTCEGLDRGESWVIDDEFDTRAFNQVLISLTTPKGGRFKIAFGRDGERIIGVPVKHVGKAQGAQIVVFDLPSLRRKPHRINQLEVFVEGRQPGCVFHTLELVSTPLFRMLPGGEGALVSADGHARRVVGLTSLRPLEAVAPLVDGAVLSFSVLHPDEQRFPGQSPRFTVTARDLDGTEISRAISLNDKISAPVSWSPVLLDLSVLKGDRVWVQAALAVSGDEPGACLLEPPLISAPGSEAPTVLLITSDTHRADALGVAESEYPVNTPHLDALAARAVRFTDCLSSTNVTSPSHVAIMTGTPPRDTGIITNTGHMAEAALTLAERFRDGGYLTFGVASVRHLGPLGTGLGQGFDRIAAPRGEVWDAEVSLDRLESWLPDAEGRPLFVWLHLFDAHAPYGPPGEFDRRYYPDGKDPFDPEAPASVEIHPRWLSGAVPKLKDPDFALAQYRAEVDYLDHQLGRILERSRFREGVVAFTADHGESFGAGGVWFSHVGLFPATLRVPMLLSWPGGPRGMIVDAPIEHIHLGRTLLDLSGLQGSDFPGESLLGSLEEGFQERPRYSLSANGKSAAVIHDGWQLTLNLRNHDYHGLLTRSHHQVELFQISEDPKCEHDSWESNLELSRSMRRLLVAWLADTRGASWARTGAEDPAALAQLAALGYTMDVPETDDRGWFDLDCECDWCQRLSR